MDFWERIDARIADIGTTRKAIAGEVGINANNFASWKTRHNYPSVAVVTKLAAALGTSVEYLVTGEPPAFLDPADRDLLDRARTWRTVLEDLEALEPAVAASWAAGIHGAAVAARETKKLRGAG